MKKNKKKILFVQPIIPHYRVPFFSELNKIYNLELFAQDNSNKKYCFQIRYSKNTRILKSFYWQSNLLKTNFKNYDLVIFNVNPKYISTVIALIICKLKSIKTIDYNHSRSSTSRILFVIIRNLIVKFLTNGRIYYTKKESDNDLNNKYFNLISPINLGYANNSIDTKSISKLRKEYIPNRRSDFLFVGRLTTKSKVELLIESLKYSKIFYKVNILGESDMNSNYLKNLATRFNVKERIIWHRFSSNESEISMLFNKSRCFVYPGEVGLSIIHGMSYGLPSIIHNNVKHHNPEHSAFTNKINGLNFKENNARSLSHAMDILYSSSEKQLEIYSKNCIKIINENFSIEKMTSNFYNSLNKVFDR